MNLSPPQALLRALIATVFFCSAPACVKAVELNAYSLGVVRLGLASLGVLAWMAWQKKISVAHIRSWPKRHWQAMLLVGFAFGMHWLLFFLSIKWASAAIGAIGFSTYGVHLLGLGWLLGRGKVSTLDVIGVLLAAVGTLLVVPEFSLANQQTSGLIVGVGSGLAAAFLPLLHQKYADVDNDLRTWGQFTFALPVFLLFYSKIDWQIPTHEWPMLLYLSLGVALAGHGLWIQATTVLSTTTTSILSYLYLPGSLAISFLAVGQRFTNYMLAGTACVLVANALVLWNQKKLRALEANVPETT